MNKMKKVFVLVLVAAIVSLGLSLTGCKKKTEPVTEGTTTEETTTKEHPAGEKEHSAGEKEHPGGEKEHPAKE